SGTNSVHDGVHALAFVVVGTPEQYEGAATVAEVDRPRGAAVPDRRGSDEAGQFGQGNLGFGRADHVGGRTPATTEDERQVVFGHSGTPGQFLCRGGCVVNVVTRHGMQPRCSSNAGGVVFCDTRPCGPDSTGGTVVLYGRALLPEPSVGSGQAVAGKGIVIVRHELSDDLMREPVPQRREVLDRGGPDHAVQALAGVERQ